MVHTKHMSVQSLLLRAPYGNTGEQTHLWHGWPQQGGNPKPGYSYPHAELPAVPPQRDYTSSEKLPICFPLELVWHFVVVEQARCVHVAPAPVDGAAVRRPACWSDWKSMSGISRLSSSVWRSGREAGCASGGGEGGEEEDEEEEGGDR